MGLVFDTTVVLLVRVDADKVGAGKRMTVGKDIEADIFHSNILVFAWATGPKAAGKTVDSTLDDD